MGDKEDEWHNLRAQLKVAQFVWSIKLIRGCNSLALVRLLFSISRQHWTDDPCYPIHGTITISFDFFSCFSNLIALWLVVIELIPRVFDYANIDFLNMLNRNEQELLFRVSIRSLLGGELKYLVEDVSTIYQKNYSAIRGPT